LATSWPASFVNRHCQCSAQRGQGWLSLRQKGISPLPWGEKPFCLGEMAETGETLPDVFILRCKA